MVVITVAEIAAVPAGIDPVPAGYNGRLGSVDMAKPVDYTGDVGKICVVAGNYDVGETMRYHIWLAQNKPVVPTALTQAHVDAAIKYCRIDIARDRILSVAHKTGMTLQFRLNDVVPAITPAAGGVDDNTIRNIYRLLTASEAADAAIGYWGRPILMAAIATAIHRTQNSGHSWYTVKTNVPGTMTNRALAVAPDDKESFSIFMTNFGHDVWHFLSDTCLRDLALALVGKENPIRAIAAGGAGIIPDDMLYAGTDIRGLRMCDIFDLPESCKDRYPCSELGKSAVIVGVGYIGSMLNDVISKVKMEGADTVTTNIEIIHNFLKQPEITREMAKRFETYLGGIISFSHGYGTEAGLIQVETYLSYDKHASRNNSEVADGKSLAQVMKTISVHPEAVASSIAKLVNRIGAAIEGITKIAAAPPIIADMADHNPDDLKIAVAASESAKMMELFGALAKKKP